MFQHLSEPIGAFVWLCALCCSVLSEKLELQMYLLNFGNLITNVICSCLGIQNSFFGLKLWRLLMPYFPFRGIGFWSSCSACELFLFYYFVPCCGVMVLLTPIEWRSHFTLFCKLSKLIVKPSKIRITAFFNSHMNKGRGFWSGSNLCFLSLCTKWEIRVLRVCVHVHTHAVLLAEDAECRSERVLPVVFPFLD